MNKRLILKFSRFIRFIVWCHWFKVLSERLKLLHGKILLRGLCLNPTKMYICSACQQSGSLSGKRQYSECYVLVVAMRFIVRSASSCQWIQTRAVTRVDGSSCHCVSDVLHQPTRSASLVAFQRRYFFTAAAVCIFHLDRCCDPPLLLYILLQALKSRGVNWFTRCHSGLTYIFNFWHSGTLALSPERQSARMSEIKNVG